MDDVAGVEVEGVGDRDLAELDRALRNGRLVDRAAGGPPERPGDAAAHLEARAGRIHEGVRLLCRDVAPDDCESHIRRYGNEGVKSTPRSGGSELRVAVAPNTPDTIS